jgi:carbonic anhydrase/acetyltransferase-like protein (isoleucine patch superfamily)
MAIYKLGDKSPTIDASAYVAAEATLIGEVILEKNSSVWSGAVIRGDNEPIRIGAGTNVQEGAVLHADPGFPLTIEANVTVGHQAMLHGCTVGEGSLIGIHAVVLNGAVIGRNCLVGAGALVTEGKSFPDNSLIVGAPARLLLEMTAEQIAAMQRGAAKYVEHGQFFKQHLVRID